MCRCNGSEPNGERALRRHLFNPPNQVVNHRDHTKTELHSCVGQSVPCGAVRWHAATVWRVLCCVIQRDSTHCVPVALLFRFSAIRMHACIHTLFVWIDRKLERGRFLEHPFPFWYRDQCSGVRAYVRVSKVSAHRRMEANQIESNTFWLVSE